MVIVIRTVKLVNYTRVMVIGTVKLVSHTSVMLTGIGIYHHLLYNDYQT